MSVCSVESAALHEPLPGTASFARAWIVVEHAGPWGRDAVAESRLPTAVRDHLLTAKAHGISVLLARHPDRPERVGAPTTNVWVARSSSGGLLLRHGVLDDLAPIARWDLAALAEGSLPAIGALSRSPLLLVCTHSRRDRCCAVNGRALLNGILDAASPDERERVWECSHVGGHRFAPVTVSLPSGAVHGRLDAAAGPQILRASETGHVLPDHLRGRSALPQPHQAAEIAVRQTEGLDGVDDLDVLTLVGGRAVPATAATADGQDVVEVEVRHRDGRAWRVALGLEILPGLRPESCGKDPVRAETWTAGPVTPAPAWS